MPQRIFFLQEARQMSRKDLIRAAAFYQDAMSRWQEWAKALLKDPPSGMWGDQSSRMLLARELRWRRRQMKNKPDPVYVKAVASFQRDVAKMLDRRAAKLARRH